MTHKRPTIPFPTADRSASVFLMIIVIIAVVLKSHTNSASSISGGIDGRSDKEPARIGPVQMGASVAAQPLLNDPRYSKMVADTFQLLTPENAMKFAQLQPSHGLYDFRAADALVSFAAANRLSVHGHTLVWHKSLPPWLETGNFSRPELTAILRDYIFTVVGHYRGRVAAWDVVNEALADDGSLRDSIWLRGIGPEYIELAFRCAHEADPDARLFYNDHSAEGMGRKSDAVYALVRGLREQGVPIDGVGLQMHVSVGHYPASQDVATNMDRLGALGLEVGITEMDVRSRGSRSSAEEELAAQAKIYGDIARVCEASSVCGFFTTWGVTDRYSWLTDGKNDSDAPLLFDKFYRPKPAYLAVRNALALR